MDTLNGKGAVVTGGASGIGLATAKVLASKGAKVVLADIEQGALDRAVAEVRAAGGGEAHGVVCDVRSLEAVQAMADAAFDALGTVHVVFNNAGIAVGGPILDMTHDDWRWTIDVDLWGPIHGVEAFLPRIVEQGEGGHILFTASFAGLVPNSGLGPYCVAKYGVVALGRGAVPRAAPAPDRCVRAVPDARRHEHRAAPSATASPTTASAAEQSLVLDQDATNADLAGRVIEVDGVARLTVDAIEQNRLYILPHEESRESIRRRFERIDRTFEPQPAI